ncbi:MAG: GH3 auxin-responsive promoter family protein [Bacteroidota bacterium]|nr:GH3 auxin-responsive promoter family protein [Bacteroidota bacterium]
MQIINSIISWLNVKRIHQIELFRQYPFNVQQDTLQKLIQKAKDTEWGKKHYYENILTVEDFQNNVPLQDYEDIKGYINRLREGEQNILWPGEIKWFAKSSGTTSDKSKFIPVSKDTLEDCHFRGGKDIMAIYTDLHPNTKIFSGKGLTLGGSHQINNFSNQSYYGDLSAILIENVPWWVDIIRTPRTEIALLDKWEEKLAKITEATIRENVTNIAGVPSWNLVLIKHILEYTGKNNLLDVWPNLELFTHGGVSFAPYREQFKRIIPSEKMNYMEAYNASEGFFAIQDDPATDDMLLMLDYGIFYEFIPMDEFHKDSPKAVTIDKVEIGKNYAIVISTNSGLWRYIIGDTVIFTSVFPHKIKISGRTRHFINAFGEEVIIDNAEKALQIACEKTNSSIREYTAGPVFMTDNTNGAHEWLIEFEQEPENLDYFTTLLDNALCSINSDYEAKRYKNVTLRMPIVRKMKRGVFFEWMKEKGKLGGQNKVPRLANNRQYIDEILSINTRL